MWRRRIQRHTVAPQTAAHAAQTSRSLRSHGAPLDAASPHSQADWLLVGLLGRDTPRIRRRFTVGLKRALYSVLCLFFKFLFRGEANPMAELLGGHIRFAAAQCGQTMISTFADCNLSNESSTIVACRFESPLAHGLLKRPPEDR